MNRRISKGILAVVVPLAAVFFVDGCGRSDPIGCRDACQSRGETRCLGNIIQVCVPVSEWCLAWSGLRDCGAEGAVCRLGDDGAYCAGGCNTCTAPGEARCKGEVIQVCVLDENGCLVWRDSLDCGFYGEHCTMVYGSPRCTETCRDTCSPEGSTRCGGLRVQTCLPAGDGCLEWQTTGECAPDEACDDSSEPARCVCTDACRVEGATRCNGDIIETCVLQGNGCLDWVGGADCAAEGLVCAERPAGAVCEACVPDCAGRACGPDPVCGVSCGECQGETEICREDAGRCEDVCEGRECGTVEGIDCGACEGETELCREDEGFCEDVCAGIECGVVEGILCGMCPEGEDCVSGVCYGPDCDGEMCLVPAGTFWMGCNEEVDIFCEEDEHPYHEVYLDTFEIDRYEVTQARYFECMQEGPCAEPGHSFDPELHGDLPVVGVTWFDAETYCEWAGKRLCTEAEWEKAARGTDGRRYPWGNEPASCEYAVMDDGGDGCGTGSMMPVGSKPEGASPYGALDMAGNVREYVYDFYSADYYEECVNACENPTGPSGSFPEPDLVVLRGGYFGVWANVIRSSRRDSMMSYHMEIGAGFRCCR